MPAGHFNGRPGGVWQGCTLSHARAHACWSDGVPLRSVLKRTLALEPALCDAPYAPRHGPLAKVADCVPPETG
jgi:hypothetical protein